MQPKVAQKAKFCPIRSHCLTHLLSQHLSSKSKFCGRIWIFPQVSSTLCYQARVEEVVSNKRTSLKLCLANYLYSKFQITDSWSQPCNTFCSKFTHSFCRLDQILFYFSLCTKMVQLIKIARKISPKFIIGIGSWLQYYETFFLHH